MKFTEEMNQRLGPKIIDRVLVENSETGKAEWATFDQIKNILAGNVPVAGISLDKVSAQINIGDTLKLTPTITPFNATNKEVTWSVSDNSVLEIDQAGNVKLLKKSSASVIVTTKDGGFSATCNISDKYVAVESVSFQLSGTKYIGDSEQLIPIILPENSTNKEVLFSCQDPNVNVTPSGYISYNGYATTWVRCTVVDGGKYTDRNIFVRPAVRFLPSINLVSNDLAGQSINKDIEIFSDSRGSFLGFSISGIPSWLTVTKKEINSLLLYQTINFQSTSPLAHEVTLTFTQNTTGQTFQIIVSTTGDNFIFESSTPEPINVGKEYNDQISIRFHSENLSDNSDPGYEEISNSGAGWLKLLGVMHGASAGPRYEALQNNGPQRTAIIVYEQAISGKKITRTIIQAGGTIPVTGISISTKTASVEVGKKQPLTAAVTPSDATNKNKTWSIDKPVLASLTVHPNGECEILCNTIGTVKATATSQDGNYTDVCTITIVPPAAIPVTSVTFLPNPVELFGSTTQKQLVVEIYPTDASDKTITWSVMPATLAYVDSNNIVHKLKNGSGIITAKVGDKTYNTGIYCED